MWEYFCDECYYHMWAVRNDADKSFTSAIHVMTEDEAKFITDKLNELQSLKHITAKDTPKLPVEEKLRKLFKQNSFEFKKQYFEIIKRAGNFA